MANVVPEEVRKRIGREYVARFVLATSAVSLALSFVAFLSLLPIEVGLQIEGRSISSASGANLSRQQITADRSALTRTQSILSVLEPYTATSSAGLGAVRALIADRPAGLSITSITYVTGSKTIALSGQGSTVSSFGAALRADQHFTSVQIPVGALVGGKQFTITLNGAF